jgi:trigger factor
MKMKRVSLEGGGRNEKNEKGEPMPYQVEETGTYSRKVQVTVPAEDYQQEMNKTLRKLSKRVKISGFRKGKIPLSVMRRHYGEQVRGDVIEQLLRDNIDQVLEDQDKVIYLGQPSISALPQGQSPLEFSVDVELRPSVDPVGYMGLEVERPKVEVTDEQVDERLEALREQFATLEPIALREEVKEGDIVELDFRAVGDEPALEQLSGDDVQIEVGANQSLPGIEEALVGAAFGSTVTTTIQLPEDFPIAELADQDVQLEIKIKSVKKRVLPEVDDEFAADTGKGQTLIELRANIREEIVQGLAHQAQHLAEDSLVERLLEQNPVELPPLFVLEQIDNRIAQQFQQMTGQQIDPRMIAGNESFDGMREDLRENTETQLKSEFLLMAIAEKEGIQVNDADLTAFFEHQSMHMEVDAKTLERFYRQDQSRLQQAAGSALLEKTLGILLAEAKIVDVEWPEDEEDSEDVAAGEEE